MVIIKQELSLTKYEGDDVSIQCRHHDGDQKSFCKAHEASTCVKDGDSLETIRDARFSISDEASAGVFTVNITDLRADDSGVYWCGAHVITKVNLRVKRGFSLIIIIISVCVIVLLICGFTLTVCKSRHKRTAKNSTSNIVKNTTSSDSRRDPGSAEMISPDEGSSDGLLYASVTFHKHQESLSEAAVTFRTSQVYSDYTTVVLPQ
ncbi:CMRF35-like molecule 1 [Danio aesculapii]|uniref:CMRF35-like molecule 1 n=1 Tax=Danio aesculapii TaxID=1142201 RepID=UPI0024BF8C60|nr:CMRF35-like molecule 1 [Danio aesculapii]